MDIGGIIVSTTALGVRQSDDTVPVGTTANALRHILAAQWSSTGVIDGLKVTGTSSLAYHVAAGTAVCSKGSSDGKTLAYFEGANTPTINSNSSGNPRIDCIYIYSNDLDQGDSDNLVHIGVVQGTPAANPSAPSIPTYGTLLAQMLLPAGSASTSSAYVSKQGSQAIPYMLSTVQSDGIHIWAGTDVFSHGSYQNGAYNPWIYLWGGADIHDRFPGLTGNPTVMAQNGDWNAHAFTVSGTAQQGGSIIVFGTPTEGLFRINWVIIGQYDPSLVN
jgi:hypothetical protein